jgi:hypothetical protein
MQQVVLQVEDQKLDEFIKFLKTLDFVKIQEEIPEWQQNEVAERLSEYESGKELARKWKEAQATIFRRD